MPPDVPAHAGGAAWLRRLAANRAAVLGLLALWLLLTLGWRPLLLPDEGRYANIARDMLGGGALVPRLNGLPFFHKPPLWYWLDMAAMSVFGPTEFAGRFGSAVGGWVMGAALFLALDRWRGRRSALIVLGVLATCPFFFLGSQYANLDMLVAGLITAAVLCLVRALEDGRRIALRWLLAAWAAAALAVLAKGLIGIVLPGLIVLPWVLWQRGWRSVPRLLHPAGLLLFFAIAAPWFVAMQQRFPAFYDAFFIEQHFRRFTQSGFNNVQPFWFYFAVLPLATLPWSLWLPPALARLRQPPVAAATASPPALGALFAWWAVAVLLFFTLPSAKIVGYVLPALAPWCALLGLAAASGRAWRWGLAGAAAFCAVLLAVLLLRGPASYQDVGRFLAAQSQPGDTVVFADEMYYDVPYYARLSRPPIVLSDWASPDIAREDNWRRELHEGAQFDPARANEVLWTVAQAAALRCRPSAAWFVAKNTWAPPPALAGLEAVYRGRHAQVLRFAGGRGAGDACPSSPP